MTSLFYRFALPLTLVAALAVGCDDDGSTDAGIDAGAMDAGPPRDADPGFPDGTVLCETDGDCDDGVDCTMDSCGPTGACRFVVDNAVCQDDLFCNGVEQCNPRTGCEPGPRETCNDDNVCTIDRCNEETKTCDREPRDLDADGDPDFFCEGGGDCDDGDPRSSSLLNEVCGDFIDNDCDGAVDDLDPEGCGRQFHDDCTDTLDVSAGGFFLMDATGTLPDYMFGCGTFAHDVVAHFTLTEAQAVTIEAEGDFTSTGISLRGPAANYTACDENGPPLMEPPCAECTGTSSEVDCDSGFPAVVRRRSLGPGTYFVVIGSNRSAEVGVRVTFEPPLPAPTNESCSNPLDVSAGGTFTDSTVEVRNDITTMCGFGAAPDLIYTFTTTMPQNVQITVTEDGGATMNYEVRTDCAMASSQIECERGDPASGTLFELPAGTYFIVVEGPTTRAADFTLDVQFLPPMPPPAGDLCSSALPLTPDGTVVSGTFAGFQDDLAPTCSFGGDDVVYTFNLAAASDLWIDFDGPGVSAMSLRNLASCTTDAGDLRCINADPVLTRVRNVPAGDYALVLESRTTGSYTVSVDATSPPTVPVMVTGNDTCDAVPANAQLMDSGGLFTGTTVGLSPDYMTRTTCRTTSASNDAVFELTLTSPRRVLATTEGSLFDTTLHIHNGMCTDMGEIECNDDANGGTRTSQLDVMLSAGTYYFIVDGFGSFSTGTYFLEIQLL